jgi:hypothetical protein
VTTYDAALLIVDKLTAAGIVATSDPRAATPPCVLVVPPDLRFDLGCGATATWSLWALVPNPGNADAHKALAALVRDVAAVLPVERADLLAYALAADAPALPAYRMQYEEATDI